MARSQHPKRDAGTRGLFEVLRHPGAALTAPFRQGAPAGDHDLHATSGPDGRVVTCFLRSSFAPFPQKWTQGGLHLNAADARWAPGLRLRGGGSPLPTVMVQDVRDVEGRERLHVKVGLFQVIEATTEHGELALAVPKDAADRWLSSQRN